MKDKYYKEGYMKPIDIDDVIGGPKRSLGADNGYDGTQPIAQCTLEGKLVQFWDSVSKAARQLNIRPSSIYNNLRGLNHSAGGFVWRYA